MLKCDVLEVTDDKVTKEQFTAVRGESEDGNAFWKTISSIAVEKFNMKEVFNMNSTVRLTAIEKLGTYVGIQTLVGSLFYCFSFLMLQLPSRTLQWWKL